MTGERPIRVLLVEDNEVYRTSLAFLLGRERDLEVVGAVGEGAAAARACAELAADAVVLDYRLPDVDGAQAAEEVRARCPGAAVILLSASVGDEEQEAARTASAPLVGKDAGVGALVAAIREAVRYGA
ncbi:MAG TPA: response regulator [Thermodesulfobacteriota bacterium]|nr:response regulator [Thermodesulfobacteriota bacterium]